MRVAVTAVLLSIALAGCSSGSDPTSPTTTPTASDVPTTATPAPPSLVAVTDLLHFSAPPAMTPIPPSNDTATEAAFPATFGSLGPTNDGGLSWTYTLRAPAMLAGRLAFHVRVVEPLLDLSQGNNGCAWQVTMKAADATVTGCATSPVGPVMPGVHEIDIELRASDPPAMVPAGSTLQINAQRFVASASPNDAVYLLTGATSADSRLQLQGLDEPMVPPA